MVKYWKGILVTVFFVGSVGLSWHGKWEAEQNEREAWRRTRTVYHLRQEADLNNNGFLEESELVQVGRDLGYIVDRGSPLTVDELKQKIHTAPIEKLEALLEQYKNSQ